MNKFKSVMLSVVNPKPKESDDNDEDVLGDEISTD